MVDLIIFLLADRPQCWPVVFFFPYFLEYVVARKCMANGVLEKRSRFRLLKEINARHEREK